MTRPHSLPNRPRAIAPHRHAYSNGTFSAWLFSILIVQIMVLLVAGNARADTPKWESPNLKYMNLGIICLDYDNWKTGDANESLTFDISYHKELAAVKVQVSEFSAETPQALDYFLNKADNEESSKKVTGWFNEFANSSNKSLENIKIAIHQDPGANRKPHDSEGKMPMRILAVKPFVDDDAASNETEKPAKAEPNNTKTEITPEFLENAKKSNRSPELQIWKGDRPEWAQLRHSGETITVSKEKAKKPPKATPAPGQSTSGGQVEIEFILTNKVDFWPMVKNQIKGKPDSLPLAVRLNARNNTKTESLSASGYKLHLKQSEYESLSSIEVGFPGGNDGFCSTVNDYCIAKKLDVNTVADYQVVISEKRENQLPRDAMPRVNLPLQQSDPKKLYMYVKQNPLTGSDNAGELVRKSPSSSPGSKGLPASGTPLDKVKIELVPALGGEDWKKIANQKPLPYCVFLEFEKRPGIKDTTQPMAVSEYDSFELERYKFDALLSMQVGFKGAKGGTIQYCRLWSEYLPLSSKGTFPKPVGQDYEIVISGKNERTIPDDATPTMKFGMNQRGDSIKLYMYLKKWTPTGSGSFNLGVVCLDPEKWQDERDAMLRLTFKLSDQAAGFNVPLKVLRSPGAPWKLDEILKMDLNSGTVEKMNPLWAAFRELNSKGGDGAIAITAELLDPNNGPLPDDKTKSMRIRVIGPETASKKPENGNREKDPNFGLMFRLDRSVTGKNEYPHLELQIWKDDLPDWVKSRNPGEDIAISKSEFQRRSEGGDAGTVVPGANQVEISFVKAISGEYWNAITTKAGGKLPLAVHLLEAANSKEETWSSRKLPENLRLMMSPAEVGSLRSIQIGFLGKNDDFCPTLNAYLKNVKSSPPESGAVDYEIVISGKKDGKIPADAAVGMSFVQGKDKGSKELYIYAKQVQKSGATNPENSTLMVYLLEGSQFVLTSAQREKVEWGLRRLLGGSGAAEPRVTWDADKQQWAVCDFESPPKGVIYLHSQEDSELFKAGSAEPVPYYFISFRTICDTLGTRLELAFTQARVIDGGSVVGALGEKLGIKEFVGWKAIPLDSRKAVIGPDAVKKCENMGADHVAIASASSVIGAKFYRQSAIFRNGGKNVTYEGILDVDEIASGKAMPVDFACLEKIMAAWKVEIDPGTMELSALEILKAMPKKPGDGLFLCLKPPAGTEDMLKWLSQDKGRGGAVKTALAAEASDPSAASEGTMILVDNFSLWSSDRSGTRAKIWDAIEAWLNDRGDVPGPVIVGIFGGKCQEFPPEVLRNQGKRYAAIMEFRRQEFSEYRGLGFGSPPWAWASLLSGKETEGIKDADRALLRELLRKARKWNVVAVCPPLGNSKMSGTSEQRAQDDIGKEWAKRSVKSPLPDSLRKMTLLVISREDAKKEVSQPLGGKMNVTVLPSGNDLTEILRKTISESLKP